MLRDYNFISGITSDSRNVRKGYGFVMMKGVCKDGLDFLKDALERGASIVFTDREISVCDVPVVKVDDSIDFFWDAYCDFYHVSPQDFISVAVTGTNGKTTICFLLEQLFGKDLTLRIGTLGAHFGNTSISLNNTTPSLESFLSFLRMAQLEGIKYLVMEASSHALVQRRLGKMQFDVAVFTNLSRDHLDYHNSMDDYFMAKSSLFFNHLKDCGKAVVCIRDKWGEKLTADLLDKNISVITVGCSKAADVVLELLYMDVEKMKLQLTTKSTSILVDVPFIGEHNALNVACSFGVWMAFGFEPKKFSYIASSFVLPPGRLERLFVKGRYVFIDYAHTPDALKIALETLSKVKEGGRLFCVFGCGGNRDVGKRPVMGKIASQQADFVIITSDNPRWEDPSKIVEDIFSGIDDKDKFKCKIILDRKEAIFEALSASETGDIVLIAGKGHENYQEINGEKINFSDKEVVSLWEG